MDSSKINPIKFEQVKLKTEIFLNNNEIRDDYYLLVVYLAFFVFGKRATEKMTSTTINPIKFEQVKLKTEIFLNNNEIRDDYYLLVVYLAFFVFGKRATEKMIV